MCIKLGYDLKQKRILFPRNLRNEQDKVVQLVQVQHNPEMDKKIKQLYPMLCQRYGYQDKHYIIRPPMDFEDFIQEGVALLHCVCTNGYYRGYVEGTRLIFFVRDMDECQTQSPGLGGTS